jgi:hypothetical protein
MTIRRYLPTKDSTITNAFKQNLTTRATDANMGESDVLEVFSLYGQASSDSTESSRILIEFPIDKIVEDRNNSLLPPSGNVNFILKLDNAAHQNTLPKKFNLTVNAVSRSWEEGYGLDMEGYSDIGPANWLSASSTEAWTTEGGDFHSSPEFNQFFEEGTENLELDITSLVEEWIDGTKDNNGLIIKLSSSLEQEERSYYTKKFFSRGSEFFYRKPWIEARFDATVKDDRGKFYLYNPFVPEEETLNNLYIYNSFKGKMYDLPSVGQGNIYVRLFNTPDITFDVSGNLENIPLNLVGNTDIATGEWVETGIYKVSLGIDTDLAKVYDIWWSSTETTVDSVIGAGGEINVINPDNEETFFKDDYLVSITNLKSKYTVKEQARFNVFVRNKQWNPNSYVEMTSTVPTKLIDEMYYKIFRIVDDYEVIPYGTGSLNHTRLSFDKNINYFDLDISLLEPGYMYGIKFTVFDVNNYHESRETFKFKVED